MSSGNYLVSMIQSVDTQSNTAKIYTYSSTNGLNMTPLYSVGLTSLSNDFYFTNSFAVEINGDALIIYNATTLATDSSLLSGLDTSTLTNHVVLTFLSSMYYAMWDATSQNAKVFKILDDLIYDEHTFTSIFDITTSSANGLKVITDHSFYILVLNIETN
jgi:hypothetical protein